MSVDMMPAIVKYHDNFKRVHLRHPFNGLVSEVFNNTQPQFRWERQMATEKMGANRLSATKTMSR
jgi:hypothetical protein